MRMNGNKSLSTVYSLGDYGLFTVVQYILPYMSGEATGSLEIGFKDLCKG
jgi:hypothetical protein